MASSLGAAETVEARDTTSEAEDLSALSDADSGYDEAALSTASLQSSIFEYEVENGRSYHAFRKGKYVMPNDEGELDRMDIHYHAIRLTIGEKHFWAPLDPPTAVLDVGTGTGIWAMDVADDHPDAQVIGIDLSPTQPTAVPPNLEFQIMDCDETWNFNQKFDLVHTRLMNGFSIRSWPFFYREAFQSMKPGGWVENQEFGVDFRSDDGTLVHDSAILRWQRLWNEGIQKFGLKGDCDPQQMKRDMEAAGFINCTVQYFKMPTGPWARDKRLREAGLYFMVGFCEGVSGLSVKVYTAGLGWTVEEMEVLLMEVKNEVKSKRIHSYMPIYVITGQKPWDAKP